MEKVNLTINLQKSTFEKIKKIKNYLNLRVSKETEITEEEIIKSAIANYLYYFFEEEDLIEYKKNKELSDLILNYDLGKPYQLKNNFKKIMKEKKIKQVYLVEQTKIAKSNLSLILNNKTQPSLDYFLRIWCALGFPPLDKVLFREKF